MKRIFLIASTILGLGVSSAALAEEPSPDLFKANGCDVDNLIPVLSELNPGEVLYWQNTDGGGCDASKRNGGVVKIVSVLPKDPEEEEGEGEGEGPGDGEGEGPTEPDPKNPAAAF